MDFPIAKQTVRDESKFAKEDLDLVYAFSKELYKECQELVKAIVLFGSTARKMKAGTSGKSHDIDVLVILDDVHITMNQQLAETYRIIAGNIVHKVSHRLHVTTLKYSTFWQYMRVADPIGMNILRDGVAILDTGFFDPLQFLFRQGHFKPTIESIWQYYSRSPTTLNNSRWHILQATIDLYWAVMDSAHALLMAYGYTPPSPDHVASMMQTHLVKQHKVVTQKHADTVDFFYKLHKNISYRSIGDVTGVQYEQYYKRASGFVDDIKVILNKKL